VLDILNLAHPTVFMLGAFVALFAIATLGLPWWLAIPIAFVATGLFGIVLDRVAFAPLRRRGAPPLSAMISSLGVTLAVVRLVELRYGGDFLSFPAGTVPAFLIRVGDATLEGVRLAIIVLSIALMVILTYVVRGTRLGREIRALAENPRAARLLGIDVERAIGATFFISSGLGGLAGVLLAFAYSSLDSKMGLPLEPGLSAGRAPRRVRVRVALPRPHPAAAGPSRTAAGRPHLDGRRRRFPGGVLDDVRDRRRQRAAGVVGVAHALRRPAHPR
jgi:branched-chain amino acid transport system permease protein